MILATTATLWAIAAAAVYVLGALHALHALARVRTSQGTVAWVIALVSLPYITIPLYWVFGRNKFHGYRELLQRGRDQNREIVETARGELAAFHAEISTAEQQSLGALNALTEQNLMRGNEVDLLIDGRSTFDAIFAAIDAAEDYVLVEFFIIKDDEIGRQLQKKLMEKAQAGIRVYVLYDEIGSNKLSRAYTDELRAAGAEVSPFRTTKGRANRFQLNFRNHRKIVVVDGRTAFVGGHNVGDEYLGRDEKFGRWRDTHLSLLGPAVQNVQIVFLQDWFWATERVIELGWKPRSPDAGNVRVLALPTGPVDDFEACTLFFLTLINTARERLWIASPYFVPDGAITSALQLAALRGVDVRIIIPAKADHLMVYLAAFSYLKEMDAGGVRVFRYDAGFLHQKVLLVDDALAAVGTANLDNRSFRLNFEISIVVSDKAFAGDVEAMLIEDLENSHQIDHGEYLGRGIVFRLGVRVARLLAPIL